MADAYGAVVHEHFLDFLPPGGRVLDVGCGEGSWASDLRAKGFSALVGIERDLVSAEAARTRYDNVHCGSVEDATLADLGGKPFDLVIFGDVLEHLVDPWAALRQARGWVRDGGSAAISVPNLRHVRVLQQLVLHGEFAYEERGIMDRTHLRWFTRRSLDRTLIESGWRPQRWRGRVSPRLQPVNERFGRRFEPFFAAQNYVCAVKAMPPVTAAEEAPASSAP